MIEKGSKSSMSSKSSIGWVLFTYAPLPLCELCVKQNALLAPVFNRCLKTLFKLKMKHVFKLSVFNRGINKLKQINNRLSL
jgi:hypothetical protein